MAADTMTTSLAGHEEAPRRRQLLADAALAGITLVWGTSFVMVKDIVEQVSPFLWLTVRFGMAGIALALIAALLGRWRGLSWRELRWGALVGLFVWAGYVLQTLGLQQTTASNGGFITGLSVVLVPPIGLLILRQRPSRWAIGGIILATTGLALLTLRLEVGIRLNAGDALVLGCAFAFAVQIVLVAHVAGWADPVRLALVQVLVAGLLNGCGVLLLEHPVSGLGVGIWASAAYLGILATGLAIAVQVGVQRFTPAVHTALIFTLEPVFAAAFGVWLQGDYLGPAAILGAMLILGGMLVAELGPQGVTSVYGKSEIRNQTK